MKFCCIWPNLTESAPKKFGQVDRGRNLVIFFQIW